jgi:hypothetical protein
MMTTRLRWTDGPGAFALPLTRAGMTGDVMPLRLGRDQRRLVCTVAQHGSTGEWSAVGPGGEPLSVSNGAAGLEIYSASEGEGDQVDPNVTGTAPPGSRNLDTLRKKIAARPIADRTQPGNQLGDYQKYLDQFYAPR